MQYPIDFKSISRTLKAVYLIWHERVVLEFYLATYVYVYNLHIWKLEIFLSTFKIYNDYIPNLYTVCLMHHCFGCIQI